jgi:hypothetical protein
LDALGGFVVVFSLPSTTTRARSNDDVQKPAAAGDAKALIEATGRVHREQLGGWGWDGVALVVGVGDLQDMEELDAWEDVCAPWEMEFVHVGSVGGQIQQLIGGEEGNEFGGEL